jgi:hypothetical protein
MLSTDLYPIYGLEFTQKLSPGRGHSPTITEIEPQGQKGEG